PDPATRSATAASSPAETPASRRRARLVGNGSAGSLRTGAITDSSAAAARAKPPVKHMPMTPTPLPGVPAFRSRASARTEAATGLRALVPSARNPAPLHGQAARPGARPGDPE